MNPKNLWLAAIVASSSFVSGHPGESEHVKRAEAQARADYLATLKHTNLAHCAGKLGSKGVVKRAIERRQKLAQHLVKRSEAAALQKRQSQNFIFDKVLEKNHKSKLDLSKTFKTVDWSLLGQNKSIVLHPDTTEGPYYIEGEFVRKNTIESEKGVVIHLDIQVVDINTCTPIPKAAIEIWGANATGVYSGVVGFGNGNAADKSNLQNKALRGIQITDKEGAVQFDTILPGHYMGRTPHIHVLTHLDHEVLPNNTIKGGRITHIGQLFFDQGLLDEASKLALYQGNKAPRTNNNRDAIMAFDTAGGFDPVVDYVLLGKSLEDGIFSWINFGVNSTSSHPGTRAAGECTADGCRTKPFSFAMGGKGKDGGKGFGFPFMGKGGAGKGGMPGMPGMGKSGEMPKGLVMPTLADLLSGLFAPKQAKTSAAKSPGS